MGSRHEAKTVGLGMTFPCTPYATRKIIDFGVDGGHDQLLTGNRGGREIYNPV
jgi:hypothetical protein